MTTSYPGAVDNFTNPTTADPMNSATVPHATQHANANDAIEAIETVLGTNPQGTSSTVKDRIIAAEGAILNLNLAIDERVPGEAGSNAPGGALPNGYVWVNTTDNSIKVWNGTTWVDPSNAGGGSTGPTWAVVSGGTVTEYTHPTYGVMQVHTFLGNGTLTVTGEGMAEVLLVSRGGFSVGVGSQGNGGRVLSGIHTLTAGAKTVTVSASGDFAGDSYAIMPSALGTLTSGALGGAGGNVAGSGNKVGGGAGALPTATDATGLKAGLTSTITGTATVYAPGGDPTKYGGGAVQGQNSDMGGLGIVIVAVKKP